MGPGMAEFFATFRADHPCAGFYVRVIAKDRAAAVDLMDIHYGKDEWDLLLPTRLAAEQRMLEEIPFE